MNDQHPHAGYVGDDAYTTGSHGTGSYTTSTYDTGAYDTGAFATDPLFGALPGSYDGTQQASYDTAGYQSGYGAGHSGQYDTTQWDGATTGYVEYSEYTGQWDAGAWNNQTQNDQPQNDQPQYDTGAYDATAWHYAPTETFVPEQYDYASAEALQPEAPHEEAPEPEHGPAQEPAHDAEAVADAATVAAPVIPRPARRSGGGGGGRGRRRTPAKRSALLTVAVPSACVMGVAGIAAASVSGLTGGEQKAEAKPVTAEDPSSVKTVAAANSALDTQLAALSADARDFGDRASRTQERIDLKNRQEAERKKREEEAARREAMRPKFALPVKLHQLSAYYGQAGVNWMSLHSGIDFPVQYGTPVMAATDGTVRTQWNSAYGNMAIVTAKDGTETWYCHLSSTKIRSGEVKAGDVIAYSGNSGNSTGPHLHFEVRPGGGSPIDPLPWLRSHGLDPTG
ncbi:MULTISPECIES: M23 family metallopeptidase [unclassified Streptomyces]|uniref:M23 family metallopeptidase n=1 Tax=unclassified Streptomyces TaxID=2593676 RepID=UPI0033B1FA6F